MHSLYSITFGSLNRTIAKFSQDPLQPSGASPVVLLEVVFLPRSGFDFFLIQEFHAPGGTLMSGETEMVGCGEVFAATVRIGRYVVVYRANVNESTASTYPHRKFPVTGAASITR